MPKVQYGLLESEDYIEEEVLPLKKRHNKSKTFGLFMLVGLMSLLFYLLFIVVSRRSWSTSNEGHYTWTDCGTTSSEARSRGCTYVPLGRYWSPPECSYPEVAEDYQTFRDRRWYLDTNLTVEADVQQLESGDLPRAFTRYWHDEHCVYVMRTLALAVALKKSMVPSVVGNMHHLNHCARSVSGTIVNAYNATFLENDDSITESLLMFETCVPIRTIAFTESHAEQ